MLIDNDPSTSFSTLIAYVKSTKGHTDVHESMVGKQKAIENIYGNWKKLYHDLPRLLQAMQTYLSSMVIEKEALSMPIEQGQIVEGVRRFHHLFWSFRPCIDEC